MAKQKKTIRKAKRKPEQIALPGEEYARKVDPRIEAAEREITEARTERKTAKDAEEAAASRMVTVMAEIGLDVYKFTDAEGLPVVIRIKPGKPKVVVQRKKPRAADEAN